MIERVAREFRMLEQNDRAIERIYELVKSETFPFTIAEFMQRHRLTNAGTVYVAFFVLAHEGKIRIDLSERIENHRYVLTFCLPWN